VDLVRLLGGWVPQEITQDVYRDCGGRDGWGRYHESSLLSYFNVDGSGYEALTREREPSWSKWLGELCVPLTR
jgi:hypothetical protein